MILAFLISLVASATSWQSPPEEVLKVLHAPQAPMVWTTPSGTHMLMAISIWVPEGVVHTMGA